jgi:tol-pal system protein YbgF
MVLMVKNRFNGGAMVCSARAAAFLVIAIFLSGCAADDLMRKRQAETEAKIEHLIQLQQKSDQRFNDISSQLLTCSDQNKLVMTRLGQFNDSVKELRNSQDELKAKLLLVAQQAATPKIEVVNPVPAKGVDAGPPAEYVKAFGLYSANNFTEAIIAFEAFIKNNPDTEYNANALYWIGECYYTLSDLAKAKETFFKVAGSYPNSPKAPDALLKLGYTLLALKEKEKAHAIFESLIKSYPSSPAAIKARQKLTAG